MGQTVEITIQDVAEFGAAVAAAKTLKATEIRARGGGTWVEVKRGERRGICASAWTVSSVPCAVGDGCAPWWTGRKSPSSRTKAGRSSSCASRSRCRWRAPNETLPLLHTGPCSRGHCCLGGRRRARCSAGCHCRVVATRPGPGVVVLTPPRFVRGWREEDA